MATRRGIVRAAAGPTEVENLLYAGFLGVFLGGRIGYVCWQLPAVYGRSAVSVPCRDGGMLFHGGLIGVIVVTMIFARRTKRSLFHVSPLSHPHSVWSRCRASGKFINS
ncbi:prolipoprotein diacylglyceryl transferase family protein [Shigella flexneri]